METREIAAHRDAKVLAQVDRGLCDVNWMERLAMAIRDRKGARLLLRSHVSNVIERGCVRGPVL